MEQKKWHMLLEVLFCPVQEVEVKGLCHLIEE
jgi:hypothetical protein